MSRVLGTTLILALVACTPRPWNFDETDRIGAIMAQDGEDPASEAVARSLSTPELPDVIPYPRPVYVRQVREARSSPATKGKRITPAERAKRLFGGNKRAAPARNARAAGK